MKKRIQKIINSIKQMEGKFFLIMLICALIIFCIAATEDSSLIFVSNKEDSYQALEAVVDNMSNQKKLIQPLSDNLKDYKINSNKDGTVKIELYSYNNLFLEIIMNQEYEIQSIERKVVISEYLVELLLGLTFISAVMTSILYMIVYGIIMLVEKCKEKL